MLSLKSERSGFRPLFSFAQYLCFAKNHTFATSCSELVARAAWGWFRVGLGCTFGGFRVSAWVSFGVNLAYSLRLIFRFSLGLLLGST